MTEKTELPESAAPCRNGACTLLRKFCRYARIWVLLGLILCLDQLSKAWVIREIPYGTYLNPIPVAGGWLHWVHIGNKGAAWGMLQNQGFLLACFAVIALGLIYGMRRSLMLETPRNQIAFGLFIGGVLGNLWDRIAIGHVTDFIDVHLPFYRWPAFNVADSAICVGVGLYLLMSFLPEPKRLNPRPPSQN
jgi:signal peptidase II